MEQASSPPAYEIDALARITEATLTTVELLARRVPVPRTELERQIMISQIDAGGDVPAWGADP